MDGKRLGQELEVEAERAVEADQERPKSASVSERASVDCFLWLPVRYTPYVVYGGGSQGNLVVGVHPRCHPAHEHRHRCTDGGGATGCSRRRRDSRRCRRSRRGSDSPTAGTGCRRTAASSAPLQRAPQVSDLSGRACPNASPRQNTRGVCMVCMACLTGS